MAVCCQILKLYVGTTPAGMASMTSFSVCLGIGVRSARRRVHPHWDAKCAKGVPMHFMVRAPRAHTLASVLRFPIRTGILANHAAPACLQMAAVDHPNVEGRWGHLGDLPDRPQGVRTLAVQNFHFSRDGGSLSGSMIARRRRLPAQCLYAGKPGGVMV
jgi:hypothetical protein